MNHDEEEGELECPICLVPFVEESDIGTVYSDIEGVCVNILSFMKD
tara:strand:+ start:1159 stop:1296 length:138 start_codon:yes stop_codon:yes gene_type:complete